MAWDDIRKKIFLRFRFENNWPVRHGSLRCRSWGRSTWLLTAYDSGLGSGWRYWKWPTEYGRSGENDGMETREMERQRQREKRPFRRQKQQQQEEEGQSIRPGTWLSDCKRTSKHCFWANQSFDCTTRRNDRKLGWLADEIKAIKPNQMTFIVCERL